ncbi:MAG: TolC family protein [Desulfovibrionaceae bacterium]
MLFTFLRFRRVLQGPKFRVPVVPLLLCLLLASACTSQKATQKAPELPARHWLEESPGIPIEKKAQMEAAVPNLYDPNKKFMFDDCVYLSIQQSPMLVNSAVELETRRLQLTDAIWRYLPEPRMNLVASTNMTQQNQGSSDVPSDYGSAKFRIGFSAEFPNPLLTYFNAEVQKLSVGLAIATHRKAVGNVIKQIAEIYLNMQAQTQIMEEQKTLLPLTKKTTEYWKQVEATDGRQGAMVEISRQKEREAELKVEKSQMQATMQRTKLKIIAGVEPQQQLTVDAHNANTILDGFDGYKTTWEERWNRTEDELLVRTQVKLQDYNIMVAWAAYVPDMSIQVNNNPPSGQYQPVHGKEDTFVHLSFDFPLLDWGRRYRGVQTARMGKAKAFHEQARKRTDYSNKWLQAEQRVALADTSYKIAKNSLEVAELEWKQADISFNEGTEQFPTLLSQKERLVNSRIEVIKAELEVKLAKLQWMELASLLQERYIGPPAKEVM